MIHNIVPYDKQYDEEILKLEDCIVQGKNIQIKIIKDHFFDRARVFEKYMGCLTLNTDGSIIAASIGARTPIIVNGTRVNSGVGFDVKVHPNHRNKGIARMMAQYIYKNFFVMEGLTKNFTTLKTSNIPVVRLLLRALGRVWLYNFVYLTIPVNTKLNTFLLKSNKKQLFTVGLFDKEDLTSYYTDFNDKLGYFHTYKMYRLKIEKISSLYKIGINIMKKIQPGRYANLPKEKETIQFATLYNHHAGNIQNINLVLEQLKDTGINYLMVCCQKNDCIYSILKDFSINSYGYYILSDFPLTKNDKVTIDVRCL